MILGCALLLFQTGTWSSIPPLPTPRQEVGVAAVEGRVLVIGGIDADRRGSSVVEIYDTPANQWRPGPPVPIPIHHPMVAAVGSKVYVAGGYTEPGFTPVANTFELDTDASEEQLASLQRLTERYCVVYQTLRQPLAIAVSLKR